MRSFVLETGLVKWYSFNGIFKPLIRNIQPVTSTIFLCAAIETAVDFVPRVLPDAKFFLIRLLLSKNWADESEVFLFAFPYSFFSVAIVLSGRFLALR